MSCTYIKVATGGSDLLALHAANPQRYPYLLQSGATQPGEEGWDILFGFPGETIRAGDGAFLSQLDQCWHESITPAEAENGSDELFPFCGGWFLFLDYELAYEIEPRPNQGRERAVRSHSYATRIPAALLYQHATDELFLVAEQAQQPLIAEMERDLQRMMPVAPLPPSVAVASMREEPSRQFLSSVERIKRYIVEGDLFQVNLSRQWQGQCEQSIPPYQIYQRLRTANPAPFSALALQDGEAIISSSPERLVRVRNGVAETRPIAGTHPRGASSEEDQQLSSQLLQHPKEQAEHIMLIDLERNDLGRVCEIGTVEVDELMVLESYAHVHHIVSNVKGRLRTGVSPGALIRALFPGGTITGCPKVRCMEVIHELEREARGAYTGSLGYLNHNGSLDLNILIRTITQRGGQVTLRAGAGIVYDSIP
ncbi:MAG: aminodeoxychorismate synthase component I, partial [Gammaproteobacteria bacterium]|nr:aminodeoxychorismate synthase component I [Gammaproteobacteria bacterium]